MQGDRSDNNLWFLLPAALTLLVTARLSLGTSPATISIPPAATDQRLPASSDRSAHLKRQLRIVSQLKALGVFVEPVDENDPRRGWEVAVVSDVSLASQDDLELILSLEDLRVLYLGGAFTNKTMQRLGSIKTIEELGLSDTAIDDEGLSYLSKLRNLRRLYLSESFGRLPNLTDRGLRSVAQLDHLRALSLTGPGFSAKGMRRLNGLRDLQSLELFFGSSFDDDEITFLQQFPHLKNLKIQTTSDAALKHLSALRNLDTLQFRAQKFAGEGIGTLEKLPHLRYLSFYYWKHLNPAQIDQILAEVGKLKRLRELQLSMTGTTDDSLGHLAGLSHLERLQIDGTRVSDAGLNHLTQLSNLKTINVRSSRVTAEGKQTLKQALPAAEVLLKP